jgi:hypothetical protein
LLEREPFLQDAEMLFQGIDSRKLGSSVIFMENLVQNH